MRLIVSFFSLLFFLSFFINSSYAKEKESLPVITVVNPIRGNELGLEKADLLASLKAQWKVTDGLPATWLWQYSTLENDQLINFAKTEMKGQEFGLFLEIDRNFANKSKVLYRGQGPWYFSDGAFLISYDVEERKRLIDKQFSLFKKQFGYYPKTVGAWWIGADSLTYMQQKYGIVAALKAADQYDLDVYSLWGSPWSIPYIASKENEGIPAGKDDNSHVVILQWAARDPVEGYKDATYSVQDFQLKSYDFSYLDYLFSIFLKKPMDNIVIGLENGGNLESFENGYGKYIQKVKELQKSGKVDILSAHDFAERFLAGGKTFSDNRYFLTKAYKSENESFWYNSENFRAGIQQIDNAIYLTDLRDYSKKAQEEFAVLPNSQGYLRTSSPSVVDSMRESSEKIQIATSTGTLSLKEKDNAVTLFSGNKKIAEFTDTSVELFFDNNSSRTFTFQTKQKFISIFILLLGVFSFYIIVIFKRIKNPESAFLQSFLLFIPLFFAYPFLTSGILNDQSLFFDRKQLWIFSLLPAFSSISFISLLSLFQVLPLLALVIVHYFCIIKKSGMLQKVIYYVLFILVVLFYIQVPYFPLDKSTYLIIGSVFFVLTLLCVFISIVVLRKTHSKKIFFAILFSIPFLIAIIASTIYISRTKMILAPFETEALQEIKNKHKDVIFVSQTNYGVKPIYKAVKPVLYENYQFGGNITGTKWELVEKSEKNIVDVSQYGDKLIVIPRYLGADFSEDEMNNASFKKVFDNGQIAVFEKK